MKFAGPCSIVAALLLLSVSAQAQDTDAAAGKPYASIVARNMFGLLPIPPPDTNPPAPPVDPPPKITLNGIMTIFGRDQALFKVATKPAPGQPAKDNSYVLSEGERQDDIEVTKINHTDGIVSFNNHGTTQELPLVAANSGAAPAGGGGGPGNPAPGFPRPGGPMSPADRAAMFRDRQAARTQPTPYQAPSSQQSGQNIEDQVMSAARDMALTEQYRIDTQDLVQQGKLPPPPPTRDDARRCARSGRCTVDWKPR